MASAKPADAQTFHIAGGTVFDFGAAVIAAFRVGGIEPEAALVATDPTPSSPAVSFTADGAFTGTMVALVAAAALNPRRSG